MTSIINRRSFLKSAASGAAVLAAGKFVRAAASGKKKPNFVFILTDDQGWNGLSVRMNPSVPGSGSSYYNTPRLAEFTRQGMRFSQAYAPAPTCSPTRYAIQFGRSPHSLRIWGADRIGKGVDALPEQSLANRLKQADSDYVTAHMGKWHIAFTPRTMGYDVAEYGDGHGPKNNPDSDNPEDPKMIFSLTRKANTFIEKQVKADRPFYLQISHYADHLKYQALSETIKKYRTEHAEEATKYQNSPLFAAMNENLDTGIGMVLDKIDELGIRDNTYVIITSDNGFEDKKDWKGTPVRKRGYYKAFPQRSHKYHVSEGGIRVPFIVRGPGIPANKHSSTPVVGTDIFPTVMEIVDGGEHIPEKVEGASLLDHLKSGGEKAIRRKDPFLVFKYTKPHVRHDIAIVQGKYKLIKDIDSDEIFLYNLKDDIGESRNLADEQPQRAEMMYKQMTDYLKRFGWDESMVPKRRKFKR